MSQIENQFPFVSIIVAAYNAEKTIEKCLNSLLNLDYPNYEIIVVDNNSSDNTAKIVKKYAEKTKKIIYLFEKKKGWPAARNKGIKYSKAEIVANIDSDCFATRDWLKTLLKELLSDPKVGGVVGKTKVEEGKTLAEKYYAQSDPFNFEKKLNNPSIPWELIPWGGGNNAYRKAIFEKIGYYDSETYTSGADVEFHYRLKKYTNYKIKYVPNAIIYHAPRGSIKEFFKVSAKYTYDAVLRFKEYSSLKIEPSQFISKKIKEIIKNILGFHYRCIKFLLGRETKLRVVEPFFDVIGLLGALYGYLKAQLKKNNLDFKIN